MSEAVEPSDAVEQSEAVEPVQPNGAVEPVEPVEPSEPSEPSEAVELVDDVVEPSEPVEAVEQVEASATEVRAPLKTDRTLREAEALAREALDGIAEPGTVGEHVALVMDGERLATHYFSCTNPAYRGWQWAVSVARAPRQKFATVCETSLVPGVDAVLSPTWLPYAERLAPGDLGPGDVLPYRADDPLLEPGFEATGDEDVDEMALFELGLGRPRVLSAEGRDVASQRWYDGSHGPTAEIAERAAESCSTCGFFVPMAGALRQVFGVCASEWSPSDGTVVSLDHGCGAHSETRAPEPEPERIGEPVIDELALDLLV